MKRILVVGGGISGMAAAIALRQAGYEVDLVEEDPQWRVLGAGITVLGSTLRALMRLGLLETVLAEGYFAFGNNVCDPSGELLYRRTGIGMRDADLPTSGGILRPVLHNIMSRAVKETGVSVRLGTTCQRLEETSDGIDATLTDGSRHSYGLVIAADGLRSRTRQQLFERAPAAAFTGQGCWRLLAERPHEIDRSTFFIGGPVAVGAVPVSRSHMYVWALQHAPDNPWVDPAVQHSLLAELLRGFGGIIGRLRDELGANSTIVYRPLESVLVPPPWNRGRILLLGDAAHATTPHLASGAGMGLEDALVLAESLRSYDTLDEALAAHTLRRFPRCKLVVESSLAIGRAEMDGQPQRIAPLMDEAQHSIAEPY